MRGWVIVTPKKLVSAPNQPYLAMNKIYKAGDFEAAHENPAWRDKANFIIATYLGEKDGRCEWEQLWAHRLDEKRFAICCIPFFAFDLALGDEVETDESYVLTKIVKCSGNYTFRVWFGNSKDSGIKVEVETHCTELDFTTEWSSPNLLAISVSGAEQAQQLADYLQSQQTRGNLIYETGKTA